MNPDALDILERLEKAHDLVPSAIVREAEAETSPLHDYLEWDDAEAARRYRMFEAARLMALFRENGRRDVNRVRIARETEPFVSPERPSMTVRKIGPD